MALYSLSGELVSPLADRPMPKGLGKVSFPTSGLKGVNVLVFDSGRHRTSALFFSE
ncbi:MAG: hypothetical protein ABIW76_18815 [Fibrobacteria bacterium]